MQPHANPLNLGEKHGLALYEKGAEGLDVLYDGKPQSLVTLLAQLQVRAKKCVWNDVLIFEVDESPANLLTQHGKIPPQSITQFH